MRDRRLIGEMLLEAGLIRKEDLQGALEEQRQRGGRLCYHLMRMGRITPGSLYLFLQSHFGVISPELMEILRTGPLVDLLPARLAHFYQMVPLKIEGGTLVLALADVDNRSLVSAVEELTGLKADPLICPPSLIREALCKFYPTEEELGVIRDPLGENMLVLSDPASDILPKPPEVLSEKASSTEWLRSILGETVRHRCREILIEPLEGETRVSYRQTEGEQAMRHFPPAVQTSLGLALQDLSRLTVGGRMVPREGRFRLGQGERRLAVLVSSLPGLYGDSYHLRLMEEQIRKETLAEMLENYQTARGDLEVALARGKGLLLLAAPEGHYRERVLEALLRFVRPAPGRIILLAPSRAPTLAGVETRPTDSEGGIPFADMVEATRRETDALLSALLVERQQEMATLLEAAADGIVVAGVREADAFETLEWLIRRGFLSEIRAGHLCGILSCRMVERVCEHCRRHYNVLEDFPHVVSRLNGGGLYFTNTGCGACRGAGILELEPAFEFLPGDTELGQQLTSNPTADEVRREHVRLGMKTLFASTMARAASGEVDVREPLRLLFREGRGGT